MFRHFTILAGASLLALAGCKSDIPQLNFSNASGDTLSISRSYFNTSGTETTTVFACINAPTAWGGPTQVSVSGTLSTGAFTNTPTNNASRSSSTEITLPRAGYSWYCHDEPERSYELGDQGQITWQFAGQNDSALVFTIIGGTSENLKLPRFAAHQVNAAGSQPPFYWEPLSLSGNGSEENEITVGPNAFNDGLAFFSEDDGQFYLRTADGTLKTTDPGFLLSEANIHDDRLLGLGFTEAGLQATVSTDGEQWQLSEVITTDDGGTNLHENPVTGDYVASLNGNLYTSTDGLAWSNGSDTGLSYVSHYAVLPNGTQIAAGSSQVRTEVSEGTWSPVLDLPEGSTFLVFQLITAGDAAYLLRQETVDESSPPTFHLYRSEDGQQWTELLAGSELSSNLAVFTAGERVVLIVKEGAFVSDDGGMNWAPFSVLPAELEEQIVEWSPYMSAHHDGLNFLSLSVLIGDPILGSRVRFFIASEDLETFQVLAGKPEERGDFGQRASSSSAGIVTVGADSQGLHMHKLVKAGESQGGSGGDRVEDNTATASSSSSGGGASPLGLWLFALLLLGRRSMLPSRHR